MASKYTTSKMLWLVSILIISILLMSVLIMRALLINTGEWTTNKYISD